MKRDVRKRTSLFLCYLYSQNHTDMEGYNYIDIVIVLVALGGLIGGLRAGLILEVAGVAGLILGLAGARLFGPSLLPTVQELTGSDSMLTVWVAYLAVFAIIGAIVQIIARIVTKTMDVVALGGVNKLLGGIFGGIKYILLFSILLNLTALIQKQLPPSLQKGCEESRLYEPVKAIVPGIFPYFRELVQEYGNTKNDNKTNNIEV